MSNINNMMNMAQEVEGILIPEGVLEAEKSLSTWNKQELSKPISFEQFEIIAGMMQTVDNPKETREALKGLYSRYATADAETRKEWEEMALKKTKARFIGVQTFYK